MPKEIQNLAQMKIQNRKLDDVGSLADYLDQEVVIWEVEFKGTKYGAAAYVTISLESESEKFIVLTHSTVTLGQLQRFDKENVLPMKATLVKKERYYLFE